MQVGEVLGWNGYIDRQGSFYPTCPIGAVYWNGSFNCHEDFAEEYLQEIGNEFSIYSRPAIIGKFSDQNDALFTIRSYKDYLIYELGWVDISWSAMFSKLYINCANKLGRDCITREQENTIELWKQENTENMKETEKKIWDEGEDEEVWT